MSREHSASHVTKSSLRNLCEPVGSRATVALVFVFFPVCLARPMEAELGPAREHRIVQSQIGGAVEAWDSFGFALAAGDFDGDGREDLAIGAPRETVGGAHDAGAVFVVYGTPGGLGGPGARTPLTLDQDQFGVGDVAESGDLFGWALVTGNFNGDLYDDLAVGVPGEDADGGAIQVFYGSPTGLDQVGDDYLSGTGASMPGLFGDALASGAVDLDAYDELLVGAYRHDPGSARDAGGAMLFFGSSGGLDFDTPFSVLGEQAGDTLGLSVGIGHVRADGGNAELVIGAPNAGLGLGVVYVVEVPGGATTLFQVSDRGGFGADLVVDDFFGLGFPQMLVGAPLSRHTGQTNAGVVDLFGWYVFPIRITQGGAYLETPEASDFFGEVVGSGDFDGDGLADAVLGVSGEDDGAIRDAGVVQIVYGDALLWSNGHAQVWSAADFGDLPEEAANLGQAVAAGDFDGDGADDLAIGIPGATVNRLSSAGAVQIVYGRLPVFRDGFESGDTSAWGAAVP